MSTDARRTQYQCLCEKAETLAAWLDDSTIPYEQRVRKAPLYAQLLDRIATIEPEEVQQMEMDDNQQTR